MDTVHHFLLLGVFLGIVGIIAGEAEVIHGAEAVSEQKNDLRKYHHHHNEVGFFHVHLMQMYHVAWWWWSIASGRGYSMCQLQRQRAPWTQWPSAIKSFPQPGKKQQKQLYYNDGAWDIVYGSISETLATAAEEREPSQRGNLTLGGFEPTRSRSSQAGRCWIQHDFCIHFCPILSPFVQFCPPLSDCVHFWIGTRRTSNRKVPNLIPFDTDPTSAGGGWGRHPRGGRGGGWERGARLELLDDDDHHGHLPQLHRHQHLRLPPLHLWWIHLRHMWQMNWKIHKQCCSCYTQRRGRFSNMPVMKDVKCIFYPKVANFNICDISKLTVILYINSAFRFVSNSVLHG